MEINSKTRFKNLLNNLMSRKYEAEKVYTFLLEKTDFFTAPASTNFLLFHPGPGGRIYIVGGKLHPSVVLDAMQFKWFMVKILFQLVGGPCPYNKNASAHICL